MMYPTYIDVNVDNPAEIVAVGSVPLLPLGAPGTFDDSGITLGSIVKIGGDTLVYYTGWKRRRYGVSFELSIGVARLLEDGDRIERLSLGPCLSQNFYNPYLVAGPFVTQDVDRGRVRMWFCSGTGWVFREHGPEPLYTVFHTTSVDGVRWEGVPDGPLIARSSESEVVSAPWVVNCSDGYAMYYCFRGSNNREDKNYVIGVAISENGEQWSRVDQLAGLGKSADGWDSEMVCYPAIYRHVDRLYLFYSGNAVGRGGIGFAVANV